MTEAQRKKIARAVNAEREACAKQCEDIYAYRGAFTAGPMCSTTLKTAAAAIRARRSLVPTTGGASTPTGGAHD